MELLHTRKRLLHLLLIVLHLVHDLEPLVLEALYRGDSSLGLVDQHLGDQVLCLGGNRFPNFAPEVKFPELHFPDYDFLVVSVEWG